MIQSYTQWMKNFDEDYFFRRPMKIWNPDLSQQSAINSNDSHVDIQFFPEGGEWVNGFKSKLGFKAIGPDGLARIIKGKIIDNDGQLVADIQSNVIPIGNGRNRDGSYKRENISRGNR